MKTLSSEARTNGMASHKQFFIRLLCLIILCFISSPSSIWAEGIEVKGGFIEVQVVDPKGNPVFGAMVTACSGLGANPDKIPHALTNTEGKFKFSVKEGNYVVTAASGKFESTFKKNVVVKTSKSIIVILKMKQGAHLLEGIIRDKNEKILDARVAITKSYDYPSSTIFMVDMKEGKFQIRLPKGPYFISVWKKNYIPYNDRIDLKNLISKRAISLEPEPDKAPKDVTKWIQSKAIPLKTVEANHGFKDMIPLKNIVGNAQIVSLGEATHGTREFFQLKHRILEFLVEKMGFNVFAIEANLPETFAVNDYVLTGKGDPAKALAGLYFWTWNTKEVLEMIHWMRRYNENPQHKRKIKFYGFDMQKPNIALTDVLSYLKKMDPAMEKQVKLPLQPLFSSYSEFKKVPPQKRAAIKMTLTNLLKHFIDKKIEFVKASSKNVFERMAQYVRILIQYMEMMMDPLGGMNVRERSMAENVLWLLEQEGPGTKAVLWAHNGHVQRSKDGLYGMEWMGGHLSKVLGTKQVIFGFAFNQGGFQAIDGSSKKRGLFKFIVKSHLKSTLDRTLAAVGIPIFALDMKQLPTKGVVKDWFYSKQGTRSFGAVYNDEEAKWYVSYARVAQMYDALLFVEKTSAAIANPRKSIVKLSKSKKVAENLNFEKGKSGQIPQGWYFPKSSAEKGFRAQLSKEAPQEGTLCMKVWCKKDAAVKASWTSVMQALDTKPYQGKRVRLTGWIRGIEGTKAGLWLRVDRPESTGFFDNMMNRPVTESKWTKAVIEGQVAADAKVLNFGCLVIGPGPVYFDHLTIEIIKSE